MNINYSERTLNLLGPAQEEVIKTLALVYLEEIVTLLNDHQQIFTLLQYAMSRNFKWELSGILKLIESCPKKESQTILESLEYLNRICWGNANLESTYRRLGHHVPSLKIQRETVCDLSLKTLIAKFSLSVQDQFYYAVPTNYFKDQMSQLPFDRYLFNYQWFTVT